MSSECLNIYLVQRTPILTFAWHCIRSMNSDQILKRPTVKLPWSPDEWKAEVRAKSIKAFNMVYTRVEDHLLVADCNLEPTVLGLYATGGQREVLAVEGEYYLVGRCLPGSDLRVHTLTFMR